MFLQQYVFTTVTFQSKNKFEWFNKNTLYNKKSLD